MRLGWLLLVIFILAGVACAEAGLSEADIQQIVDARVATAIASVSTVTPAPLMATTTPLPPANPTPTPTPIPGPAATPTSTPTPTNTPQPTATPTPTPSPAYTGPLFDTHLHAGSAPIKPAEELLQFLDKNQVLWAIMFDILPPSLSPSIFSRRAEYIEGVQSRAIFLHGVDIRTEVFAQGLYDEDLLRNRLQPQGPYHGIGEITLYRAEFQSVSFGGPQMEAVFRVVNEMGGVVTIHPRDGSTDLPVQLPPWKMWRTEDSVGLKAAIKTYPNITFVFHGNSDVLVQHILPLMSDYPNIYYTFDVLNMMASPWKFDMGRIIPLEDAPDAVDQLLANVDQVGLDAIVEQYIKDTHNLFQQHPDRIFWGTDRFSWMWEEPASDLLIRIGRRFIGRLPVEVQEAYAYQNALRVFGRYLIPSK